MYYTLGEAAKATSKSKPTIARAIKRGLISATKTVDGAYQIDPAELSRVFQLASDGAGTLKQSVPGEGNDNEVSLVRLQLLLAEREDTIRDLRQRLNDSEIERRDDLRRAAEERRMLLAMLTDQRARPFWRRWFR